ncbi:unnamed protein product [Fraxinus pennsylvanica]|uniref:Uncharacterized protein n=1 Tax=Fraxinus pennsylvanica TaxID=56036 RepID=A0AAD2A9S2_9LAMI|nr:unnamed protein product [Fraxinus pennsylvanica]
MYLSTYCSLSSILRACRIRAASAPSFSSAVASKASAKQDSVRFCSLSNIGFRTRSFSSSLRSSALRWSHGVDWRSPVSLRAQTRTASPVLERLERKNASMGMIRFVLFCFVSCTIELEFVDDWT